MKVTFHIDTDMISIDELEMLYHFFQSEIDRHKRILNEYQDGIKE